MSHLIVEIPKTLPDEGKWLFVIAENWIENDILFLPDSSYSAAHKIHLLKGGTHPDVVNWDRHHTFKIIDTFGTYEEARLNLPQVESGLSILDNNNTGRGQRERKKKKLTLPGESTTDFESENEVFSKPAPQSVVKANKHSKKSPTITSRKPQSSSTPILKPPAGLQINKNPSNVTEIPAKKTVDTGNIICCRTSRTSEDDDSYGTQDHGKIRNKFIFVVVIYYLHV
ncbi:uncharacterized protein LOC116919935 isoform X2 [Daphnia magna]|uniref:uncharacterized protein LOC116919935 isoform X2 n=1 Tax=Daphnia magna TaxID=35525 RepID=UPI001E1BA88C|nr:uncharacterized protein LOC116919935 isoform X2 [Daphnia magna]